MKSEFEIIGTESVGDAILVTAQGRIGRAKWKPYRTVTLYVDATKANERAYHIGRKLALDVRPK